MAQVDNDIATRVMGWRLQGNRWLDANDQDTGFRTTTWKPSEDVVSARAALKKWIFPNRTARLEEQAGIAARVFLFEENLQGISDEGTPINVGLEVKRAAGVALPEVICAVLLS